MSNKSLFIKTNDLDTKKTLENEGFQLLNEENGFFVFLNNKSKMNFNDNYKNVICTNSINV